MALRLSHRDTWNMALCTKCPSKTRPRSKIFGSFLPSLHRHITNKMWFKKSSSVSTNHNWYLLVMCHIPFQILSTWSNEFETNFQKKSPLSIRYTDFLHIEENLGRNWLQIWCHQASKTLMHVMWPKIMALFINYQTIDIETKVLCQNINCDFCDPLNHWIWPNVWLIHFVRLYFPNFTYHRDGRFRMVN